MNNSIACAYIRVSTNEQLEYSPDSQIKSIKEYAKNNNLTLCDDYIFIDEGISGRKTSNRPEFNRMIALSNLKPPPFRYILVWKFSRFTRNREDSVVIKAMLKKKGIEVVSISEPIDTTDKSSIIMEALIEAMDEYYSLNLSEEVSRGMNEKFSRGELVNIAPFGYTVKDNILEVNPNTAPVVQMIYNDFLSNMTTRQIAIKLNNLGITSTRGNKFENRTVEYILRNPTYVGKLRRNLKGKNPIDRFHQSKDVHILDGKHKPIITIEQFQAVQHRLDTINNNYPKYSRIGDTSFMLRGLVVCSNCGATLTRLSKGKYLQCHRYSKGTCNVSHSIKIDTINQAVLTQIQKDLFNNEIIIDISNSNNSEDISNILLTKEYQKLERITQAYENGIDTLEEYSFKKKSIIERIQSIKDSINIKEKSAKSEVSIWKGKAIEVLSKLNDTTINETIKNTLLREIVSKIIFNRKDCTIELFYHL